MTAAPGREPASHLAPASTQFSSTAKIGPMMVKVTKAVIRTVHRGVTKRSMTSGTFLCSHFSTVHINRTANITGITWP